MCPRYGLGTSTDYTGQSGYIYPVYSSFRQQLPCPPGTMDNGSTGVNAIATCAACTAGYACPAGTGTDATG